MKHSLLSILFLLLMLPFAACIEDTISTSPADQPVFSVDTVHMGRVFTDEGTPTYQFRVYNRHDKVMSISDISFKDGGTGYFRLNVDGLSGNRFNNIEIRPNDSIFVFIEATLPANGELRPIEVQDIINFTTNGVVSQVVLSAYGQDVVRFHGKVIAADTVLTGEKPHQIFDSLVVAPGVTLTIEEGTLLYFHDSSDLRIHGTLITRGTPEAPVMMGGDRTGYVAADIPYEIMSRQWDGVTFTSTSHDNSLSHTVIENTWYGVILDSISAATPEKCALQMVNCRLRNAAGHALEAHHSSITATGCEFAEAGDGVVLLRGGSHIFDYCTFSNNYLFSFMGGPLIDLIHVNADETDFTEMPFLRAHISNSILYGSGAPLSHGDLTGTEVYLNRCLMGVTGEDDDYFTNIIWDTDPMWWTDRSIYLFDYRLRPESPALGAAYSSATPFGALPLPATDFYGNPHPTPAAIGAYELRAE